MKKILTIAAFAASLFILGCATNKCENCECGCQGGWVPLFGGGLSGADYDPQIWSVSKDGVLTATKDVPIFSKKNWENFELEFDFLLDNGTNSGVFVYCSDAKNYVPKSIEVQIADNAKFAKPRTDCGSIYGLVPAEFDTALPVGIWQRMKVRCEGKKIDAWINGRHCSKMDMSKWTDEKTNPDGSAIPPWLAKGKKCDLPTCGKIGFQGKHGKANISLRNIRIKNISK